MKSEAEVQTAPKPIELSAEETELIQGCRRQSDAQASAAKLSGKQVRLKQVRGYCCIFVGSKNSTNYFGYTWREALLRLLISLRKKS